MTSYATTITRVNRKGRAVPRGALVAIGLLLLFASFASAQGGVLEGRGRAVVDGVLSAGEWDTAGRIEFRAKLPPHDGGGDTPATLYVMHDEGTLYLAVRLERAGYGLTQPLFEFDNDNDGLWFEPGDDIVHMYVGDFEAPQFFDVYRHPCAGSGDPSFAGCSSYDTADGGTTDGATAAGHDGFQTVIELSHPLDDDDDAHDFSLSGQDAVGMRVTLHLFSLDRACNFGPDCVVDTDFSTEVALARSTAPAVIDVMPGSDTNPINVGKRGVVPVAILGTLAFDALSVDPASVCFGAAADPARRNCTEAHGQGHAADVNADGLADLVLHFETGETGIQAGDARTCLDGRTWEGRVIEGCDAVRAVAPGRARRAGSPRGGRGA